MGKRKHRQQEEQMTAYFMQVLQGRQIPLLPLDAGWHELFPDFRKTGEIRALEKKLNRLIQKQGQTTNDLREYEKARKILMKNIVDNMTDGHETDSPIRSMKQDRNQKLLADLQQKTAEAQQLQRELPDMIAETNRALLVACMRVCYQELMENTYAIEEIDAWILQTREKLKDEILKKQDMEMRNTEMYKYMHKLLGAEIVDLFDREHQVWKGNMEENHVED